MMIAFPDESVTSATSQTPPFRSGIAVKPGSQDGYVRKGPKLRKGPIYAYPLEFYLPVMIFFSMDSQSQGNPWLLP